MQNDEASHYIYIKSTFVGLLNRTIYTDVVSDLQYPCKLYQHHPFFHPTLA